MIIRAFVLACRIMAKIFEIDGHNDYLEDGAPHCHIRRDLYNTQRGIKPKPLKAFTSPEESQSY
jgi:hypothetical protein